MWSLTDGAGAVRVKDSEHTVQVLAGKARVLGPQTWTRLYCPFRLTCYKKVTVVSALQRDHVVSAVCVTKGGYMRVDVFNAAIEPLTISAKTPLVTIMGGHVNIHFLEDKRVSVKMCSEVEITDDMIKKSILQRFPAIEVGRPNSQMHQLRVRAEELSWKPPTEMGRRTPFRVERSCDKNAVMSQLLEYERLGYLARVSCGESVYLNPLYPILKPSGSYRLVNDFRMLNSYFDKTGTFIKDTKKVLHEIGGDNIWHCSLDIKDAYFSVPIDSQLSHLFGFTFDSLRWKWQVLPQGFLWSGVLFNERLAEVLNLAGEGVTNYADDIIISGKSKKEVWERTLKVAQVLSDFGLRINPQKSQWLTQSLIFAGYELQGNTWSNSAFLDSRSQEIGSVTSIKDLERAIGILSYARNTVQNTERILRPLRCLMREVKAKKQDELWWERTRTATHTAFKQALHSNLSLSLPTKEISRHELETDWSQGCSGYLLFEVTSTGDRRLIDLGSCVLSGSLSSFLGEFTTVGWACRRTKQIRGDKPLKIYTDNMKIQEEASKGFIDNHDKRVMRIWGWILGNEMAGGIEFVYKPGSENVGADLLSRPLNKQHDHTRGEYTVNALAPTKSVQETVWNNLHFGHVGVECMYRRARLWKMDATREQLKERLQYCRTCQKFNPPIRRSAQGSLVRGVKPGEAIHLDIVIPIRGISIVVLVDSFSHLVQLRHVTNATGETIVRCLEEWFQSSGPASVYCCDGGSNVGGREVSTFLKQWNCRLVVSNSYDHRSNGVVERCNRTVVQTISKFRHDDPSLPWEQLLSNCEWTINHAWNRTTKNFPIELWSATPEVINRVNKRRQDIKDNNKARKRHRWKLREFSEHQRVWVFNIVAKDSNRLHKMQPKWLGPVYVEKRLSFSVYLIRMGNGVRRKVHADFIKPYF